MNLVQMHTYFRQYSQQMGMQNTRAILPEQIDLLINTSISDTISQLIKENIGIANDRVITDNSKIGQINAFSTLYKVKIIDLSPTEENGNKGIFTFSKSDRLTGRMTTDNDNDKGDLFNYLFLVDFSINYVKAQRGFNGGFTLNNLPPLILLDELVTNYYPVRLIDDCYLADTLNDFILKNRLRSPIIVTYNNNFDLYIDEFKKYTDDSHNESYMLDHYLLPYKLRISYIAKPANVEYISDLGEGNTDCDLPEYMHVDIVKHAVDLYNLAITGSMQAAQQQQQVAQRENTRNNYRNEGNS